MGWLSRRRAAVAAAAAVFVALSVFAEPVSAMRLADGRCVCKLRSEESGAALSEISMESLFGGRFYRVSGRIREFCPCSLESVQALNRDHIMAPLARLLRSPFFRYFRVDLNAECPFWDADGYCTIRDCGVDEEGAARERELSRIDLDVAHAKETLQRHWPSEVDASWTNEAENSEFHYVDLLANPERYTGYRCEAGACHVWHEVHAYNTFHTGHSRGRGRGRGEDGQSEAVVDEESEAAVAAMPVEHRVLYRAVSGLHASISSHIAAGYLLDQENGVWGVDLDEYRRRVAAHPDRLTNLHAVYLVVLHAVESLSDYLLAYDFSTGHPAEDAATQQAVQELLSTRTLWPVSFDEDAARGKLRAAGADGLLVALRTKFHNISRIMDCVGCQRCRLWGKLQVMGLGTALRLLYAPDRDVVLAALQRNHVVALINGLGRLAHSIEVARLALPLLHHASAHGVGVETAFFPSASTPFPSFSGDSAASPFGFL